MMDFITIFAAIVVVGSAIMGLRRRFGKELGSLVYQLTSLAIVIFSIWIGWIASHGLMRYLQNDKNQHWPMFIKNAIVQLQKNPNISLWIAFIVCYLIFSGLLHRLMRSAISGVLTFIPRVLADSKWLGGVLGIITGIFRVVFYGAGLFLIIQFFSVPFLAKITDTSVIYQALSKTVYRPYLESFVTRDLPVLASNAFPSVSRSINLFTIPSGVPGQEQGVLLVPKKISDLAHRLTDHVSGNKQKAYVLYHWEIHHVSYDWHKYNDYVEYGKWDQQSPLQTLETGKGVCADYALLYADLAHASGLTVKIVEGMGGQGGQVGSHAWNEVWDNQQDAFIHVDTTWGSEQDDWFDVSSANFAKSHFSEVSILIKGGTV